MKAETRFESVDITKSHVEDAVHAEDEESRSGIEFLPSAFLSILLLCSAG